MTAPELGDPTAAPEPGAEETVLRRRGRLVAALVVVALVSVGLVVVLGGGDDGPDGAPGSRTNPLEVGATTEVGAGWSLRVVEIDAAADELVVAADEANQPPPDGLAYVLVTVEATYEGDDDAAAGFDLEFTVHAEDGVGRAADCPAVPPRPLLDVAPITAGETASGAVCALVPTDAEELLVEVRAVGGDAPVFFLGF